MEQQQNLRYYWQVLQARKSYFIWPAIIVFIISLIVALLLPPMYESTATILIEGQQIPANFVPGTATGFADQRIQSLTQQLLSRTKLVEIAKQLNLFPDMENKSPEEISWKMRERILVEKVSDTFAQQDSRRPAGITIAFRVSYRDRVPETAQKVTDTLANVYLQENVRGRQESAKATTAFLEEQLKEIQGHIKTIGQQITDFKAKHGDILPELQQFNRSQVERLETELKQIDGQMQAVQDRKILMGGQLAALSEGVVGKGGPVATDPVSRLAAVRVELAGLQAKFSEDHPDVRKLRREKAELEKMLGTSGGTGALGGERLNQLQAELADKQGRYSDQHPEVMRLKKEIAELKKIPQGTPGSQQAEVQPMSPAYYTLRANLQSADVDLQMLHKRRADILLKLKDFNRRLEAGPKVEQEYLALTREYENSTKKAQEVTNQLMTARISKEMEEAQRGEKFTLIEAANYPGEPASPNKPLIFFAGLFLSLVSGVVGVALIEHLDQSVKSADELNFITGLPVLGHIALIETSEDQVRKSQRRRIMWSIGALVIIIGIIVLWTFISKILTW